MSVKNDEHDFFSTKKILLHALQITKHVIEKEEYFKFVVISSIALLAWPFVIYYLVSIPINVFEWVAVKASLEEGIISLVIMLLISFLNLLRQASLWLGTYIVVNLVWVYIGWTLIISLIRFKKRQKHFYSLVEMFGEIIIISSISYFYLNLMSSQPDQHLSGLPWLGTTIEAWISDPLKYIRSFAECLYFSVMTITTLGAQGIVEESMASKFFKMTEVLIGFYVVATAAFSRR